ncbi:hypothetical protein RSAG8_04806, partial [Rhizoctonia solani AG-8 WAC10335]
MPHGVLLLLQVCKALCLAFEALAVTKYGISPSNRCYDMKLSTIPISQQQTMHLVLQQFSKKLGKM